MHRKKNKRAGRKGLLTRIFRNAKNDRAAGREMSAMTEDRLKEDYLIPEPEDALGDSEAEAMSRPVKEYSIGEDGVLVEESPEPEEKEKKEEAAPQPAEGPDEGAEKRIAELEQELAAARADFYNYRQRAMRERQDLRRRATEDLIVSLLPVLDNLDRALSVPEDGSAKDILAGVKMVSRQFLSVLDEMGVSAIPAKGERFDPALHEAVGAVPVEDAEEDGAVVDEQLRGYRTKDRVLRPARVLVGKAE